MRVTANTYSCSATRIRNFVHFFQGFEVPEIPKCMTPLGLQNGQIPDSAMTASSIACQPYFGRLWLHSGGGKTGGWCAGANNVNQWLLVDFGKFVEIRRISTQGRQEAAQWVTRYRLEFSYDGVFFAEYKSDNEVKVSESDITSIWISNGKAGLCRASRENCTVQLGDPFFSVPQNARTHCPLSVSHLHHQMRFRKQGKLKHFPSLCPIRFFFLSIFFPWGLRRKWRQLFRCQSYSGSFNHHSICPDSSRSLERPYFHESGVLRLFRR